MADDLSFEDIPDKPIDLKEELRREKQKVAVLEQELQQYTKDGPEAFVHELNRWVINATEYIKLKSSTIGSLVVAEDKSFERMMVLIKNTTENIKTVDEMRRFLGLKKEPVVDPSAAPVVSLNSPEKVADVYGDNQQQQA